MHGWRHLYHPFCSPPTVRHISGFNNQSASNMDSIDMMCQSERRRLHAERLFMMTKARRRKLLHHLSKAEWRTFRIRTGCLNVSGRKEEFLNIFPKAGAAPGLLDCNCHKVPQITFQVFASPCGNSFYGCCTIIIIIEQVCTIIGPLPLLFRPLIGQRDLVLQGYRTASCFSVSCMLPNSWHTVSHVDKISSIYHWCVQGFIFKIPMYAWKRGMGKISQGVEKKTPPSSIDQGFSLTRTAGNISSENFSISLRYCIIYISSP